MRNEEIGNVFLDQYSLGAKFCSQIFKQGGVCIYVTNDFQFNSINLELYSKEKDLEICASTIYLPSSSFIIICIYRSPAGNFRYFLNQLESALNKLYKISTNLILCGDFNINHLEDN